MTIEGTSHQLEPPFLVIATQNPIEYEGTYPLPEAQLDRFLIRLGVGYPDREQEWPCSSAASSVPRTSAARPRGRPRDAVAMQRAIEQVYVSESIGYYIVDLVAATRESGRSRWARARAARSRC